MLKKPEIYRLVNDYIGVSGGYLGDFSYRTHQEFYPYYCDVDIDVSQYEPGTTREKFIRILEEADPPAQARIIRGVLRKYPISHFPPEQQEQKQVLFGEFQEIAARLEKAAGSPSDRVVSATLIRFDAEYVSEVWAHALQRRTDNPEAAITSARSLLESVCKHILDDLAVTYEESLDLPKLYRMAAEQLNLAPSQHTEQVFKQILGGCQSVVEGLGSLRNKLSDAHGKGRKAVRPSARHAELAVNLAGAMAMFLIRTWEDRKSLRF